MSPGSIAPPTAKSATETSSALTPLGSLSLATLIHRPWSTHHHCKELLDHVRPLSQLRVTALSKHVLQPIKRVTRVPSDATAAHYIPIRSLPKGLKTPPSTPNLSIRSETSSAVRG